MSDSLVCLCSREHRIGPSRRRRSLPILLAFLALGFSGRAQTPSSSSSLIAPAGPTQDYLVYVVCESADKIVLIRFGPGGARIESQTRTGLMPTDINGPHGIAVSPDKQYFYVSEGHGRPEGSGLEVSRRHRTK